MSEPDIDLRPLSETELAARRRRNLWLAVALASFVVIVLAVTMVRISQGISMTPDGGF